ncbi:EAL domain-containing protein [Staphylococcus aureus]|nr:EAL domain-containing protein [Staphylococcus aureus]
MLKRVLFPVVALLLSVLVIALGWQNRQLRQINEQMATQLQDMRLAAHGLELGSRPDALALRTTQQTFVDIGIALAIDDYGAGLSSLSYLKQLPACELKIDKLFITQLTSSNRDPLIVRSTIDLAHALEMEVVAEGVETPAALALLTVMGCDMVQGYLISRPIGFDALCQFLDEQTHQAVIAQAAPLSLGRFVARARA